MKEGSVQSCDGRQTGVPGWVMGDDHVRKYFCEAPCTYRATIKCSYFTIVTSNFRRQCLPLEYARDRSRSPQSALVRSSRDGRPSPLCLTDDHACDRRHHVSIGCLWYSPTTCYLPMPDAHAGIRDSNPRLPFPTHPTQEKAKTLHRRDSNPVLSHEGRVLYH